MTYLLLIQIMKLLGLKNKKIIVPKTFTYREFIKNTSIATSTMVVKRNVIKNIKFTDTDICEDYFFKCKLLKKVKTAHRLNKFLTRYRIRKKSLQSNKFKKTFIGFGKLIRFIIK